MSGQLLPQHQLDSGEVEWSGNKGRFLHSEDVRMKVIRSSTMKDEGSIQVSCSGTKSIPELDYLQRLKDEFKAWETLHKKDQGKHIMPYYGFSFESSRVWVTFIASCTDGDRLHVVLVPCSSRWRIMAARWTMSRKTTLMLTMESSWVALSGFCADFRMYHCRSLALRKGSRFSTPLNLPLFTEI